MLQKEFFLTEPFNPNPYWENTVLLNLSGNSKYEQNTVFPVGKYLIEVQAGSSFYGSSSEPYVTQTTQNGVGGKVSRQISLTTKFIVRAYCGSKGTYSSGGKNPYSGAFKVNARSSTSTPPYVSHIFGNAGGAVVYTTSNGTRTGWGSGNCLGDGGVEYKSNTAHSIGAGSCLHIMPIGGVFGTDYLFAFHCSPASCGFAGIPDVIGGSGSAYGGAGGACYTTRDTCVSSNGGATPYGSGGTVITSFPSTYYTASGNNGDGVGAGPGGAKFVSNAYGNSGPAGPQRGAAAWFDGSSWQNSTEVGNIAEDGRIKITYLGPL